MIVGNGLIASEFKKTQDCDLLSSHIIFASGISSSLYVTTENVRREVELLSNILSNNSQVPIIYFSSSLVGMIDNEYYRHKQNMESFLLEKNKNALVVRIPQLVGRGGNPNNLFNFLTTKIKNREEITTSSDTYRALLDVEDLVGFVSFIKSQVGIVNFSHVEITSVVNICNIIGQVLNTTPVLNIKNQNSPSVTYSNSKMVEEYISKMGVCVEGYNERVIKKYIMGE